MEKTPHDTSQCISDSVQSESQRFLRRRGKPWSQAPGKDGSQGGKRGLVNLAEGREKDLLEQD